MERQLFAQEGDQAGRKRCPMPGVIEALECQVDVEKDEVDGILRDRSSSILQKENMLWTNEQMILP